MINKVWAIVWCNESYSTLTTIHVIAPTPQEALTEANFWLADDLVANPDAKDDYTVRSLNMVCAIDWPKGYLRSLPPPPI